MLTRRIFNNRLLLGMSGTLTASMCLPNLPAATSPTAGRRLITVFLKGGNDGLNTVIPATDPLYHRYRQRLRIRPADAIGLQQDLFLHPALKPLSEIWQSGRLNIQLGVGYLNHSRSHFESTSVWSEGRPQATSPSFNGWLARALDPLQQQSKLPLACPIQLAETPELLRGRRLRTTVLPDLSPAEAALLARRLETEAAQPATSQLHRLVLNASEDAARALRNCEASRQLPQGFPATPFGQKLRQTAQVIETLPAIRSLHVEQDGYDTHAAQTPRHASLLYELADGLRAMDRFLVDRGESDETLIMVFSEFGRRVQENASAGTDHGAAGPMFFVGGDVEPGLSGKTPNLEQLSNGDVAVTQSLFPIQHRIADWLTDSTATLQLPG